jgi:hypothetical protein
VQQYRGRAPILARRRSIGYDEDGRNALAFRLELDVNSIATWHVATSSHDARKGDRCSNPLHIFVY